ncbi:MAG: ATP-binding protein, partial [Aurantibacter sp.]
MARDQGSIKHYSLLVAILALLATWLLQNFAVDEVNNQQNYQEQLVNKVQSELEEVDLQLADVVAQINQSKSFKDFHRETDYPYFIYDSDSLVYWSDFHYVPDFQVLNTNDQFKFVEDKYLQYISQRKNVMGKNYMVFMLLPLHVSRENPNNYIRATFNQDIFANNANSIQLNADPVGIPITSKQGDYLFSINLNETVQIKSIPVYIAILILAWLAIICLFFYIYRLVSHFTSSGKFNQAFSALILGLISVRTGMLVLDFPGSILDFYIFDPQLFASSDLNRSLGDLFFNELTLLLIVLFVFRNYQKFPWYQNSELLKPVHKNLISIGWLTCSIFLLFLQYHVITLFYDSQWSLDIASLMDFTFVKFLSLLIIIINALVFFLITHLAFTESIRLLGKSINVLVIHYLLAALVFVAVAIINDWSWLVILALSMVYLTLLYALNITDYLGKFNYISFLYLFLGSLLCAVVGAYAINTYERAESITKKQQLADQLLHERDFLGEFLLSEADSGIQSDLFIINQMMFNPYSSAEAISRKIERVYINQHLDRYDITLNLFDSKGDPDPSNISFLRYQDFESQFAVEKNLTEHQNLYFVNEITSDQLNRYLCFIDIVNNDISVGYIILDLKLKRVIPNTVYPELLVHNKSIIPDYGFSYAVFSDGQLVNSSGNFNYAKNFDSSLLQEERIYKRGFNSLEAHHLAVKGPSVRVAVVSSATYPLRNVLANFSFLFIIFIFGLILFIITYVFVYRSQSVKLNYATRIQLYLNLAFFLPLLIVSVTTLSLISSYSKKEVIEKYFEKAEGVRNNIANTLDDYNEGYLDEAGMSESIAQLSQYSELDINLFNTKGQLVGTSQPKIYQYNLLSEFINPLAHNSIVENQNNSVLLNESVGLLEYKSAYVGVQSFESGDLLGVLSIPFFESKYELGKEIIVILINILNIFTFIFIVIMVASYFASRTLTVPLNLITQKIKKTTLTGYNEPLEWESDDEIGLMVGEYNRMLKNLEASKTALARSEKESAWREMAKQVAHEIKNPLTPMKLTLQHLKRTLAQGNSKDEVTSEKPLNMLLQQIDTLSDIATSFSSFAKMPVPKNQRFEAGSVLKKTIQLHDNNTGHKITTNIEAGKHFVMGDAQLMGRIFSNLIINGIQSVPNDRTPTIEINLETKYNQLQIEFTDNGSGIPEDIRDKIFIPNFSTKEEGSGIGLSIA